MPALTLHLEEVYRTKKGKDGQRFPVLNGVSLCIEPGSVIGIFGASGSGKSTLLRIINRLEDPERGVVRYGNTATQSMNLIWLRRTIALVGQKPIIFPGTVADNIMLSDTLTALGPGNRDKAQALLEIMRLPSDSLERNASDLSLGQQARVQLARILYMAPAIILLDETTAHLDAQISTEILDELETQTRNYGNILVHVSHQKEKLRRADRVFLLNAGKISATGLPTDIFNDVSTPTIS